MALIKCAFGLTFYIAMVIYDLSQINKETRFKYLKRVSLLSKIENII
jgi:hypothetical protein